MVVVDGGGAPVVPLGAGGGELSRWAVDGGSRGRSGGQQEDDSDDNLIHFERDGDGRGGGGGGGGEDCTSVVLKSKPLPDRTFTLIKACVCAYT